MTESLIGMTGEPFALTVEAGKIREFAAATKGRDPVWMEADAVSPPTFLTSDRFWSDVPNRALAAAPINWSRILHGEQEYVFHGPPPAAGQPLIAQERVENSFVKQGKRGGAMTFTILVTEYRTPEGELLVEARSTVIETSQAATA